MSIKDLYPLFKLDIFNGFVVLAVILFAMLTLVYSRGFMQGRSRAGEYYAYILLTAISSVIVALSNNLIILLVAWGFLGLLLYLLINMGEDKASAAAKKTLVIVGGSDALMVFGIAIIFYFSRSMQMDNIRLELNNLPLVIAYLCMAIACFAKAGAMPFHSWIPDCAKEAPIPVVAYLPASLDKLLGIYLLARLSLNLFVMNTAMNTLLMLVGAVTIISAVMMALVQHNFKRLLGYHAVSQVGYMVLGIGTGNLIGIAGGIFHMLNNAIYKSCLFFGAGNVEYRTKRSELDELGGLGKQMPITYISFLIASLSISGVPPFNGFVSKWLIYQGLIGKLQLANGKWQMIVSLFCLLAAMFGSALTLASFMKLLHAVFLGQPMSSSKVQPVKEVPFSMWGPAILLAGLCILFGIFAFPLPLRLFIFPAISSDPSLADTAFLGIWSPISATGLVILGLLIGWLIFRANRAKLSLRQDTPFVGCETSQLTEESKISGVDFYNTVKELKPLRRIYRMAEDGLFDIYEQGKKIFSFSRLLQNLHNGVLPTYLVWMLLGMVGLFFVLLR